MSPRRFRPIRSSSETSFLRRVFLTSAAVFPFWHLAAPPNAIDPWWVWWCAAGSFFAVGTASLFFRAIEKRLLGCFHVCSSLITLQFFVLSALNDMAPFFVVAWAMSVLATVPFIRTIGNLSRYAIFLLVAGMVLYAVEPDSRKLAYWGGLMPIVPAWYVRLTRQVASQRQAFELRGELERRVDERTAELAQANRLLRREMEERAVLQKQLRLSQTMEALGRLAGGVAHEFNNLLTTIRLYGELALDRVPDGNLVRHELTQIQRAAQEAAAVTEQLLDFSRGADAEHDAIDLNQLLEEAVLMINPLVGDRVRIRLCPCDGKLVIWAAAGPLERILLNLALNARDAMPDGGELSIETGRLEPDDLRIRGLPFGQPARAYASLTVTDTGIGMDAETRERAFDPFFSRKAVRRGAGLGLSIVYGIVRQTGGSISMESEPGKGTRVEVIWPCTDRTRVLARTVDSSASQSGSEHILLVEDEPDLRSAMARVLAQAGYQVTEAADAAAALRVLASDTRIDVVVSDVVMPGASGTELASQLATDHPGLRVLLVSGHADYRSLRREASQIDVAFLRKPFHADVLRQKVRRLIDGAI